MKRSGSLARRTPLVAHKPLHRRTPLRAVSPKRAAAAAAGLARAVLAPARPRSTGPDRNTVDAVLERDQYSCAWCGGDLFGERGVDWSIQHRRPRQMGGDPRPDTNSPANLVAVHGDGTTGCHGLIERERTVAYAAGFLLHADATPAHHQIKHAVHGWCLLTNDGQVIPDVAPRLRGAQRHP